MKKTIRFGIFSLLTVTIASGAETVRDLESRIPAEIREKLSVSDVKALEIGQLRTALAEKDAALSLFRAEAISHYGKATQFAKLLDTYRFKELAVAVADGTIDKPLVEKRTEEMKGDKAVPLRVAVWRTRVIPVWWENPTDSNLQEREWIRAAVTSTWQQNSALSFVGWEQAKPDSRGIRILIADAQPLCTRLGRFLANERNGMVLNISFQNWCRLCVLNRKQAIQSLAVHEFGHALGFAHEHNRDDRDETCKEEPQGTVGDWKLTIYDPDSVMNYCSQNGNNNGALSSLDIMALQILYGKPEERSANPAMPKPEELDPGADPTVP